ncbi:MAG: N-formylglutamate amidohydrolase [Proteobacteria bacterium]|nr:N-formylglutamate amidohydrolase [Pseudomonadota bacterium]
MNDPSPAFTLVNADAGGPVLLSVPHAGRIYSDAHRARLRPPVERLAALEDRLVDEVALGQTLAPALTAQSPRAWIDLNRHEAEIDPGFVDGAVASRLMLTPKVRNGLGLIPRRLAGVGELWRGRLDIADIDQRIATIHRPYHAALKRMLGAMLERHGVAILIDLHSMPPVAPQNGEPAPAIVIGNRFGQTAAPWLTAQAADACARAGLSWRENSPYAGGHIIERHGNPARGVHALQIEIDRTLYLDAAQDRCAPHGLARTRAFLTGLVRDLQEAASGSAWPLAAE